MLGPQAHHRLASNGSMLTNAATFNDFVELNKEHSAQQLLGPSPQVAPGVHEMNAFAALGQQTASTNMGLAQSLGGATGFASTCQN